MLSALKINEVIQEIIQPANGKQDLLKRGELLKVLSEEYKNVKIAEMVNMKPQAVEQGLMLANASEQVKDLVRSGAISPTAAIGALRSERSGGPPAYDVLSAMVEEAKRIGKTHATAKHSLHPIGNGPTRKVISEAVKVIGDLKEQIDDLLSPAQQQKRSEYESKLVSLDLSPTQLRALRALHVQTPRAAKRSG